mgnify:CR=1 FL=1
MKFHCIDETAFSDQIEYPHILDPPVLPYEPVAGASATCLTITDIPIPELVLVVSWNH